MIGNFFKNRGRHLSRIGTFRISFRFIHGYEHGILRFGHWKIADEGGIIGSFNVLAIDTALGRTCFSSYAIRRSFEVFTGPIVDNTGKERLAKDAKADQAWKDKIDFYVKGVEGKVPTGK